MRPTDLELATALAEAESIRELGEDPSYLARSMLYLYRRNALLESVLEHVDLFLKFGMPSEEHAKLIKLIEDIEEMEHHETGSEEEQFGI